MSNALILEDDIEMAWKIANELELHGFCADFASNLDQCAEKLARRSYDLLVADIILRDKTGLNLENALSTIFRVKRDMAKCTVIAMSGSTGSRGMQDVLRIAENFGADHVLEKPIDFVKLKKIAIETIGA